MRKILVVGMGLFLIPSVKAGTIPEVPGADGILFRVVSIDTTNNQGRTGSGVAVQSDRILTNCHVVADATFIEIIDPYDDSKRFKVNGISADAYHDACTLRVDGHLNKYAGMARFTNQGDTVYSVGFPGGRLTWSKGEVTNANAKVHGEDVILSKGYCDQGISGGAMLNTSGELVGLIFANRAEDKSCAAVPTYLLQRSIHGTMLPVSQGAPRSNTGSAYHDSW